MKLTRIEGPACIYQCGACGHEAIGGTEPYFSAAAGKPRQPEEFYMGPEHQGIYCAPCAAKLVEADPTRSRTRFYLDTAGTQIDPEILA